MYRQVRPGRWKRRLMRVLALLLLLLAAAAAWAWRWWSLHGEAWLEHTVRERIAVAIDKASVEGYLFSMEDLDTDARQRRLMVRGAELAFAPHLLDSLRNGDFRYLFAARAQRIELRGLSYWRLLLHNEFHVEAFELSEPELQYLIGGERVRLDDPFTRFETRGQGISLLAADTIVVRRASAVMQDLGDRLPVLNVSGLDLECLGLRVTRGAVRRGVRLHVSAAELRVDSLDTRLADGARLRMGEIRLSRQQRSGRMMHIKLEPDRSDTARALSERIPVMELGIDSILLTGLDVDRLISEQVLNIGRLAMHGLRVEVALDKTLPAGSMERKPLPPEVLLATPFPIRIDTLSVADAEAVYDERDADTHRWGVVPFGSLNGIFLNITNRPEPIEAPGRIDGTFSGTVFDSARVEGRYSAELDGSGRFSVLVTTTGLPLVRVNSASRPLLRMQVQGGRLHRMELRMEGDDRRAKGDMALHYTDLLVRVEPGTPRELRHSMFGSVLETMLKEAYGGGLSADRSRNWSIDRDPNRSLITYIWHATREGLARNLAPEAWGRMRTMLRTDAEQRRGQRELRRQRRQERQEQR